MDWIALFRDFFEREHERIRTILDAGGCREGWLQGQLFLCGRHLGLKTNATARKYDLYCEQPRMFAELKICGGDYMAKMQWAIECDIAKLRAAPSATDRYMILVVDDRHPEERLGAWLRSCMLDGAPCWEQRFDTVLIRIWRVKAVPQAM